MHPIPGTVWGLQKLIFCETNNIKKKTGFPAAVPQNGMEESPGNTEQHTS